jgi:hypothetical protein
VVDIAAKVLADNLSALLGHCVRGMQERNDRFCNRSYTASLIQLMLPRLLFLPGALAAFLSQIIERLKVNLVRRVDGRYRPRPASKHMLYMVAVPGQIALRQLQQAFGNQHFFIRFQRAQHAVFPLVQQTPIDRDGGRTALFNLGGHSLIKQRHSHAGLSLGWLVPVGQVGCVDFLMF